jgi:hypothetical protein
MTRFSRRHPAIALGILAALAFGAGCGTTPPAAAAAPQGTSSLLPSAADPCSERMHDICGLFLLYHALRGKLPERPEELLRVAGSGEDIAFVCPVSGKSYLYDPKGTTVPGQPGIVVLQDPLPTHHGVRWAIAIIEPGGTQPISARIIGLLGDAPAR